MSLLTEKQIHELALVHSEWWENDGRYQDYLNAWNEKQPVQHVITPNWDIAPDWAIYWAVDASGIPHWFDTEPKLNMKLKEFGSGEDQSYIRVLRSVIVVENWTESIQKRPEPVITPHPHAEMIMKYAEVAQRRVDPWVEFEARLTYDHRNTWFKMTDGKFFSGTTDFEYRHIGETK